MKAHAALAVQALAANQAALGLQHADLAVQACASCVSARVLRGRALAAVGRYGEALAEFERALAGDEEALDAEIDGAAAAGSALRVDRADFAVRVLQRALGRSSEQAPRGRTMSLLADALQAQGPSALEQALVTYRDAGADADADPGARAGLALALFRQGERDTALALARRSDPGDTERAINARALPPAERAARLAVLRMALADDAAAERAWRAAAEGGGPWCEQARAALGASTAAPAKPPARPVRRSQ